LKLTREERHWPYYSLPHPSQGKAMRTIFSSRFTWFKVKVPVLSLQIVVAEPMVSQAESRRTCDSTSI
jgi:hypothetical protein